MKKENLKKSTLLSGVILTGSLTAFAAGESNSDLLNHDDMGSGAEVRSAISDINVQKPMDLSSTVYFAELKCGEGKCGEAKCGGDDENKKSKDKKNPDDKIKSEKKKKDDSDDKNKKGKTKKSENNDESKTSESKCGEGKCG